MQQRLRVDGDIFENAPRVDADIFLRRIKKTLFQKYPETCGRGLKAARKILGFDNIDNVSSSIKTLWASTVPQVTNVVMPKFT